MNEQASCATECRAPDVAPLLSAVLATRTDRHIVMDRAEIGAAVEKLREDREHPVAPIRFSSESPGNHPAMAAVQEKLRCDTKSLQAETVQPLGSPRADLSYKKEESKLTCAPAQGVMDVLKSPVFKEVRLEDKKYHAEFLMNDQGAQVIRYWDRDLAYMDVIRFDENTTPDLKAWPLGDGFERSYHAHIAVMTSSYGGRLPAFHYIHHFEVQKVHRGKAIGTGLMRFFLSEILSGAAGRQPAIWLCANSSMGTSDEALRRFYERHGFRRLAPGVCMMYFDYYYTKHLKVDPTVPVTEVPYVARV